MEFTLLCNLAGPKKETVVLRLRLLHMWAAKAPGDVRVFNFCTLWVDETGMLIHGLSPAAMASGIRQALRVGKIYVLKTFGLSNPPNLYRACSFDLALGITPSTSFHECHLPAHSFAVDSYEFQPFAQFLSRAGDHRQLTDVVGRLHSISGVSHKITNNGPAVKQTVVIENESGEKVTITLWDEFSRIIDHVALTQADVIETVVLAFGGLLVNRLAGGFALSSSAATRASVNPQVPEAYRLAQRFAEMREVVGSLPIEFATAEEAAANAERRTRTLAQLTDLALTNASLDERHRCGGVIVDVESHIPWYYNSCRLCNRDVSRRRDNTFWCPKDWQLQEEQTRVCYKLQLTLRDDTTDARFIVMGSCGHALVTIAALYLAHRFPFRPDQLPPQLAQLRGQYVKFDCKLPLPAPTGFSSGEFRVVQVVPLDDPTVVGDLLEYHPRVDNQLSLQSVVPQVMGNQPLLLSGPYDPVSRPISSSVFKGKEKVTDTVPANAPPQEFSIGLLGPDSFSSSALGMQLPVTDLGIAPPGTTSSGSAKGKDRVLGPGLFEPATQQFCVALQGVEVKSGLPLAVQGHVIKIGDTQPPTSVAQVGSASRDLQKPGTEQTEVVADPQGTNVQNKPLIPSQSFSVATSLDSWDTMSCSPTSVSKAQKTVLDSSPGKTPTSVPISPSASLLVSPLAKVKVEKLEAVGSATSQNSAIETQEFCIGSEGVSRKGKKEAPAKRSLFKD